VAYQQLVAPLLDARSTTLICPGDQAPPWGRARVVLLVHDVRRLVEADAPWVERTFYRVVVPRGLRRASSILTVSEFSRREIERVVGIPAEKIRVMAHAVRPRAATSTMPEQGPLLVVGAVRHYKGLDTVLAALGRLPEARRPQVVVAGSIDDGVGIRLEIARLGLEGWVRLEGWVEDERLEKLYAGAIAAVCPSRYEGYGLAVAESIARGLPTIASDIPSHREIAGEAALFFPPGDDEALAECMLQVSTPELRRPLAASALRRANAIDAGQPPSGALVRELVEAS
jgi:alpha-1,3-rhamnosyl/mannosyltransferase